MMTAKDIMETQVISVSPDMEIKKAVTLLLDNHINGVPVVDDENRIVGLLCQSDLIFQQKEIHMPPILTLLDSYIPLVSSQKLEEELNKIAATRVEQAMVTDVTTVTADTPITEIANLMVEKHFHTIPVVDGMTVIGIIGKEDVLKTMSG